VPPCRFTSSRAAIGGAVASNDSDRVGDSVCGATDALIVADDRRNERVLRPMVVYDRASAQSRNLIARSDPLFDGSDRRIAPDASQSRLQIVSPACPLRLARRVRSAKRAIASSHLAFASPDR
jgi:hypothetical protein